MFKGLNVKSEKTMFFKKPDKKTALIKSISIFATGKYQHLIVVPQYENVAGIIYEQETCTEMPINADASDLGNAVIENLNRYAVNERNLRDMKKTDWPAFKSGKSNSVTLFEREYVRVSIYAVNASNESFKITGYPYKDSELVVTAHFSLPAEKSEIGRIVNKVIEACITGRIAY